MRLREGVGVHLFHDRQPEPEAAALPDRTLYPDRASLRLDQLLRDGLPQPGAARLSRTRLVAAPEAIEYVGQLIGRSIATDPGVKSRYPLV